MIAKVALSAATYAIDKPYDYLVPDDLKETLRPGIRVIVPFGAGNRRTEGMILALEMAEPQGVKLKYVLTQLDETPVLDEAGIGLALWMRERYFCTVYDAARAMLPAGLYYALQDRWKITEGVDRESAYERAGRSDYARRILDLIYASGGSAEQGRIRAAFETKDPNPALKLLSERGVLTLETSVQRGIGDKTERVVSLAVPRRRLWPR